MASPFADSIYAQPGLTMQVRQFDRNPGKGETILTAVATPNARALAAETKALADAKSKAPSKPLTTKAALTAHRDAFRENSDSTSIKRGYTP